MWNPEECFCMRLKRASEKLLKLYTQTIAPAGVTPVQYLILLRIHELQSGSLREIADAMGVDRSTLARTIRPLEKMALSRTISLWVPVMVSLFLPMKGKRYSVTLRLFGMRHRILWLPA